MKVVLGWNINFTSGVIVTVGIYVASGGCFRHLNEVANFSNLVRRASHPILV